MKHNELVERAVKWLYSQGCGFAVGELTCLTYTGEVPDVIGFKSHFSVLVECKTSKSDFRADKKKHFRFEHPQEGMGNFRFYMCEEGVIEPHELPPKWGLLYVKGNSVKKVIHPKGNIWTSPTNQEFWHDKNYTSENSLMYSCLRRAK